MLYLNLLPPKEKEALEIIKIRNLTIFYGLRMMGLVLLLIILLLNIYLFLVIQLRATSELANIEKESLAGTTAKELEQSIATVNHRLKTIDTIYNDQLPLSEILSNLSQIIPAEIQLHNFFYNDDTKKASLGGFAADRDQIITLNEKLESYKGFSGVESPASNLIKPQDIEFQFYFLINNN